VKKYFFAFIIVFLASSCNYIEERSTPHVKTPYSFQNTDISTIAILPFKNKTEKKGVEDILRSCFFSNLSLKGYEVLKLEEVDERLNLARINANNLDSEDVYKVGRIVKADAIVYGVVTKCCKNFYGIYSGSTRCRN